VAIEWGLYRINTSVVRKTLATMRGNTKPEIRPICRIADKLKAKKN